MKAVEQGYASCFQVGNNSDNSLLIYPLLFVDDTILFCEDILNIFTSKFFLVFSSGFRPKSEFG